MKVKVRQPEYEAIQFDGTNQIDVAQFIGGDTEVRDGRVANPDLVGRHTLDRGDYVVRTERGLEVCDAEEFAARFETMTP